MQIQVEEGNREGSHFYHVGDGYHYHFDYGSESTISLKCTRYYDGCLGRALIYIGQNLQHTQPHNHPRMPYYTSILASRRRIVDRAREVNYVSFSEILEDERSRIEDRRVRRELTLRRLRPAMQRARASVYPRVPQNLMELSDILQDPAWEGITQTMDAQDNLFFGSAMARDGSHCVVFMSSRFLALMKEVTIIFADGTFYISPSVDGCYQVVPLAWCLMERKTEEAYVAVLLLLRTRLLTWNFMKVICDFEDAIMNAFQTVFAVQTQGCLFHSVSAMVKHARSQITLAILMQYEELQNVVRRCCVLALLPQDLLQRGLNVIGLEAMQLGVFLYGIIRPFLEYIQIEWLDHGNRGQCLSVFNSLHRTNNACESNNRRMKRRCGIHHPNIFHFIRKLCSFEDSAYDDVMSLSVGITPSRHRSVSSVSNDARIRMLTLNLLQNGIPNDQDISHFLYSAAYTVENLFYEVLGVPHPMQVQPR